MKLFVDENIPSRTVEEVRGLGHDVLDIRGTPDQGMDDEVFWTRGLHEQRLLIVTDKGFAQHRHEAHHGLLIVRLRQPNGATINERVMCAIRQFPETDWPGLLVVMRDTIQSISRAELN